MFGDRRDILPDSGYSQRNPGNKVINRKHDAAGKMIPLECRREFGWSSFKTNMKYTVKTGKKKGVIYLMI